MVQNNWRACSKCQGLYFAGPVTSVCPAGGPHQSSDSPLSGPLMIEFLGDEDTALSINVPGPPRGGGGNTGINIVSNGTAPQDGILPTGINIETNAGYALTAKSVNSDAIVARTQGATGISGRSASGRGVWGYSESFIATVGDSNTGTGVWGHSLKSVGVYGEGTPAGRFVGDVEVSGDVRVGGADCAEEFDISMRPLHPPSPGTVMVIDTHGGLQESRQAYDGKVAGVVSGAGTLRPGVILDRQPQSSKLRLPIGLAGRVFCNVDASYAPIEVGDLLTSSDTPGHAMKASDPQRAFGAVLGKALSPLTEGRGIIAILISLQ